MTNIKETWIDLIDNAQVQDKDAPLVVDYVYGSNGMPVEDSDGNEQPLGL